jgi:hypothetical protein
MKNNLPSNLTKTIFICAVCGNVLTSYFHCTNKYCPLKEPDIPSRLDNNFSGYTSTSRAVSSSASVVIGTSVSNSITTTT